MQNAAKNKSFSPVSLAVVRVLLLLVVALCLGQTRVWGFAVTPQPASGVFESVTPSSTGENYDGCPYDASDSLLAAKTTGRSFGPGAAHIDDPVFVTSNAARRQAMRDAGIPTSQQPVSQLQTGAGRQYIYDVNGKPFAVTQQTTDRVVGHGPHWEAGTVKPPADYGLDPLGRARVFNQGKVKVEYGE